MELTIDLLCERVKNKIFQNYKKILLEQSTEYTRLLKIAEKLNLSCENYQDYILDDSLGKNESNLEKFSNIIREQWKIKCFLNSYKNFCSPVFNGKGIPKFFTLNNSEIGYTYERYFSKNVLNIEARVDDFITFRTLTSSGMSAIKLCLELLNSLFFNHEKKLLYSVGYYETLFLINNLLKSGSITATELSSDIISEQQQFNIFLLEPIKANLDLEVTDIEQVIGLIKRNIGQLNVIIFDISYQGNSFDLQRILKKVESYNVLVFVVRSLIKLDQFGLELTNAGVIDIFIPEHLKIVSDFVIKEFDKFRNAHGANLTFYEYCLLDNGITLCKSDNHSALILNNCLELFNSLNKNMKYLKKISFTEGAPFILIDFGREREEYEKFFEFLQKIFHNFGISLNARNSFGFRGLTVEYYGLIESKKYVLKICPGVYKGLGYYLIIFLLNELSELSFDGIMKLGELLG